MSLQILASTVAGKIGGSLIGRDRTVSGICSLASPIAGRMAFIKRAKFRQPWEPAWDDLIVIVPPDLDLPGRGTQIVIENPRGAFAIAVSKFFYLRLPPTIAPSARIHHSARVEGGVGVGEFCVIDRDVVIEAGTILHHHVVIGPGVRIGRHCLVKSNTVIGEEGFGIDKDKDGNNIRVPQIGCVIIGNNVEIGALNIVCAGTIDPTIIHDFVKMDDHVHIAHNCKIGRNSILTAASEISGSVNIGSNVWIGPNSSIINGISIGDGAFIGMGTVVIKSCDPEGVYVGIPARKIGVRKADQ